MSPSKAKADKKQVIAILEEMATLLELKSANVFKIRAFNNAARVLETQASDLSALIESGELEKLKGIGKGTIAGMIHELYEKGVSGDHQELRKEFPEKLFELFRIPGLGAKRIKAVYEKLDVKSVGELEYACQENRLVDLEGFGPKMQQKILEGIAHFKKASELFLISFAKAESEKLKKFLEKQKGVQKIAVAGSIRRHKEVIKDIDVLVTASTPKKIHDAFCKYSESETVVAHGETKSSIRLKSGMNCDLRTVKKEEFPFALQYFTGSKEHNVAIRSLAKKKNLKINEYGLFKGSKRIAAADEEGIYKALGLHAIAPEMRENTGEVEWALKKKMPRLIETKDLRGIFHVHSTYSDGAASLEQMIAKAEKMGLEYIGISDHSQSATYARGLEPKRLKEQWKEIEKLRKRFKIHIFKGIESDILGDGRLDYPDSILKEFDFVIGSIHSQFRMSEKEMTQRITKAMQNKCLTFVGHPTGRLLLARAGYSVDMEKLLNAAKKNKVAMELNANPHRLDLDWRICREAKNKGVLLSIHPDAHSLEGLDCLEHGIGIARKGWLEKKDVVNTMNVQEIKAFLKRRK